MGTGVFPVVDLVAVYDFVVGLRVFIRPSCNHAVKFSCGEDLCLADLVVESNLFYGEDIRAGVRGEGGVCVVAECLHRSVALQKEGKKSII